MSRRSGGPHACLTTRASSTRCRYSNPSNDPSARLRNRAHATFGATLLTLSWSVMDRCTMAAAAFAPASRSKAGLESPAMLKPTTNEEGYLWQIDRYSWRGSGGRGTEVGTSTCFRSAGSAAETALMPPTHNNKDGFRGCSGVLPTWGQAAT